MAYSRGKACGRRVTRRASQLPTPVRADVCRTIGDSISQGHHRLRWRSPTIGILVPPRGPSMEVDRVVSSSGTLAASGVGDGMYNYRDLHSVQLQTFKY